MSVRQDRFTFFGVLVAVVIVVLGYLQISQLYPVSGHDEPAAQDASGDGDDPDSDATALREREEEDAEP